MANLVPTFRCNGTRLYLDRESYLAAGEGGGNALDLLFGWEQCEGCGHDIAETGSLLGNPGKYMEGDDDCVVECDCDATYQVTWRKSL